MTGAAGALEAAAVARLRQINGLGVYAGPPLQAAFPYAVVDSGLHSDWSHKSGAGREVRLAVTVRDKGEIPARLKTLLGTAEEALQELSLAGEGWSLVSMQFLRTRLVPEGRGAWAGVIEFRARMLASG